MKCLWLVLRGLVGIVCLVCFFLNSLNILAQFRRRETITVTDQIQKDKLKLPVFTICNADGFKAVHKYNLLNLTEYVMATYDETELLEDYGIPGTFTSNELKPHKQIVPQYTLYRGRCYSFQYPYEVSAIDAIMIHPKDNVTLMLYIHEPGEEIWLNWLPSTLSSVVMDKDEHWVDFQISKQWHFAKQDCRKDWFTTDYIGLKRASIREPVALLDFLFSNTKSVFERSWPPSLRRNWTKTVCPTAPSLGLSTH